MIAISPRKKLVGGVFGLVALAWGVDLLTGGSEPRPASGAPTSVNAPPPVALPPDPPDLAALMESLQGGQASPTPLSFEQLRRDLFVPTPAVQAVLAPMVRKAAEEPESVDNATVEPLPFEARHQLQGVLTGRVPLALIDGQLFRRGAEIDGYRLLEVRRDSVVLQRGPTRVVLRVPAAGPSEQGP